MYLQDQYKYCYIKTFYLKIKSGHRYDATYYYYYYY